MTVFEGRSPSDGLVLEDINLGTPGGEVRGMERASWGCGSRCLPGKQDQNDCR